MLLNRRFPSQTISNEEIRCITYCKPEHRKGLFFGDLNATTIIWRQNILQNRCLMTITTHWSRSAIECMVCFRAIIESSINIRLPSTILSSHRVRKKSATQILKQDYRWSITSKYGKQLLIYTTRGNKYQEPLLIASFNLIPAWISNHMHSKVMDEITHPFRKHNDCTVVAWEGISYFISHIINDVITYQQK